MRVTTRAVAVSTAALGAAMVLAACGSGTVGGSSGGSAGNAPANNNKNLVLVAGVQNEPFYISMNCGAQANCG